MKSTPHQTIEETAQAYCHAALGRCDITPPVGIYHRMWGAAMHDTATGVHRPLTATLLWMQPDQQQHDAQLIYSLDHCILDRAEIDLARQRISQVVSVPVDNISITLTHTHGSGWMSRSRSHLPGGELIADYLDVLVEQLVCLAVGTLPKITEATLVFGYGKCKLAAHRDFLDPASQRFVCGFNPSGFADDTLVVAAIYGQQGERLGTLVNYACHPTTLAWDNTLVSPDWVGAMREKIEDQWGGLCLFLQGASGDLGPKEGFLGDPQIADKNGRQVAFAALSALEALAPPNCDFQYQGAVTSGTQIGVWHYVPETATAHKDRTRFHWLTLTIALPYRHDLPTVEQTTHEREYWLEQETQASAARDTAKMQTCRAEVEQRTRQLTRLRALHSGNTYKLSVRIGWLGNSIWIMTPGELYQVFQRELRSRLHPHPVIVTTLTNDWQPGYIPPAAVYGYSIYQEVIAATAPGCLEVMIESITRALQEPTLQAELSKS
jgi:hypothetical protein